MYIAVSVSSGHSGGRRGANGHTRELPIAVDDLRLACSARHKHPNSAAVYALSARTALRADLVRHVARLRAARRVAGIVAKVVVVPAARRRRGAARAGLVASGARLRAQVIVTLLQRIVGRHRWSGGRRCSGCCGNRC